jgi:hypothetical protein
MWRHGVVRTDSQLREGGKSFQRILVGTWAILRTDVSDVSEREENQNGQISDDHAENKQLNFSILAGFCGVARPAIASVGPANAPSGRTCSPPLGETWVRFPPEASQLDE